MFHGYDPANHYGRPPTLVDAGTGVVIAAEFRKMCLPRNPATTTPSRSATTSIATAVIATRLPRPILTFFTIWSIAWSFSMSQSDASIVPMRWTKVPQASACRFYATSTKWTIHEAFVRLRYGGSGRGMSAGGVHWFEDGRAFAPRSLPLGHGSAAGTPDLDWINQNDG